MDEPQRTPTAIIEIAAECAMKRISARLDPRPEGVKHEDYMRALFLATKKRMRGAAWEEVRQAFPDLPWKPEEPIARFERALMERQYVYVPDTEEPS